MVKDADLLRELRNRALDESEPLAGLLRTCLALGAITGSADLRSWATQELRGYGDDDDVPSYRKLSLQLLANSQSGYNLVTGQSVSRFAVPEDVRSYVPEQVSFKQPVEDLSHMASAGEDHNVTLPVLALVASRWNQNLPFGQEIIELYFRVPAAGLAGMLGAIRTTLLEMVLDMTKDVPLDELPSRQQVDAAVQVHVYGPQDQYHVNVATNSGVIGQGPGSVQTQNNISDTALQEHITAIREALAAIEDPDEREDVAQAVHDFEEAVATAEPEQVHRRGKMLLRRAAALGGTAGTLALQTLMKEGVQEAFQAFGLS